MSALDHLRHRRPTLPVRALAFALAWLVIGLDLVSASPQIHALVHHTADEAAAHADCDHRHAGPEDSAEHVCAVVLFAGGVEVPSALFLPLPATTLAAVLSMTGPSVDLAVPRYLRQPERGPPAGAA